MDETSNSHVEQYLDYYLGLEEPPEFAVMLKGSWGCGKTWFIQKYLKNRDDAAKELEKKGRENDQVYISLYGVTTSDDIDTEIFKQLHPLLSSKGAVITKGILNALLGSSIQQHISETSDASFSLAGIKLPDMFPDVTNKIIVFDDFERSLMNISDLLGYINTFVEHKGNKVIIIANEDEILQKTGEIKNEYIRKKEKTIGTTLKINTILDEALGVFISKVKNDTVRELLDQHKHAVIGLYSQAGYNNLRHLKQAIMHFEKLYSAIDPLYTKNIEFLNSILQYYLVFSIEIYSGKIMATSINTIHEIDFDSVLNKNKDNTTRRENIRTMLSHKYVTMNFLDIILDAELWVDILGNGYVDKNKLNASILESRFFVDNTSPLWLQLWYYSRLSDKELHELLEKSYDDIEEHRVPDIYILKHLFGIYLTLKDMSIIKKSKKNLLDQAKKYVDYLGTQYKLPFKQTDGSDHDSRFNMSYGFQQCDSKEFKSLTNYIDESIEKMLQKVYPIRAIALLEQLPKNVKKFKNLLIPNSDEDCVYMEIPILAYMDANDFVEKFLTLQSEEKLHIGDVFSERYRNPHILKNIKQELAFLKSIKTKMIAKTKNTKGKLVYYYTKIVINDHINKAIEVIEEYNNESNKAKMV